MEDFDRIAKLLTPRGSKRGTAPPAVTVKSLARLRYQDQLAALADARHSVLRWWWEYLRLSRDYWMVCQTSKPEQAQTLDSQLAKVYDSFGNIWDIDFDRWWLDRGVAAFAEHEPLLDVSVLPRDPEVLAMMADGHDHLWVNIPVNLRRRTIMLRIGQLLDAHETQRTVGSQLELSRARFRVNPVWFRLHTLATMHDVYCLHRALIDQPAYHARHPDPSKQALYERRADLFRIGKLLRLSPSNARSTGDRSQQQMRYNRMRATVGRFLSRARLLIAQVELGQFPVFKAITPSGAPRFTQAQLARHRKLDAQWWSLELGATTATSRAADAKQIHYNEYRS